MKTIVKRQGKKTTVNRRKYTDIEPESIGNTFPICSQGTERR